MTTDSDGYVHPADCRCRACGLPPLPAVAACYLAGRCQCAPHVYELPDFHPATGHLHTCTDRLTCECAAALYCLAQDAEEFHLAAPLSDDPAHTDGAT